MGTASGEIGSLGSRELRDLREHVQIAIGCKEGDVVPGGNLLEDAVVIVVEAYAEVKATRYALDGSGEVLQIEGVADLRHDLLETRGVRAPLLGEHPRS